MSAPFLPLLALVVLVLGIYVGFRLLQGLFWVLGKVFRCCGGLMKHVARFARNMLVDAVHFAGAILTAGALLPLAAFNGLSGRFASARHYGRAIEDELGSALLGLYRLALGHPLRFIGLGGLLDGVERRVPDVVDRAPNPVPQSARTVEFPGYRIFGTLQPGGSGAKLFLARPTPEKRAQLREAGHAGADEVVIKYFALEAGSTLPQIVRENQALKAASRLGLVLEHELSRDRFHYVMRYVSGEELDTVIHRLHASCGPEGLRDEELSMVGRYACDLLHTLDRFHGEGLWHKDVKPSNLIVADGHVHLVDLGLVTPLRADITLTTHGTEYYRDPEMVRLALQGVRVHEVDGVKFDIYSAGAVLYSMVEDSFPAHGSLSRISKRCPEALRWIIRRAMTDMNARYASSSEMLQDLMVLASARDPFTVRPADLPSFVRDPHDAEPAPEADFAGFASASDGARPRPLRGGDYESWRARTEREDARLHGRKGGRRGRRRVVRGALAAGVVLLVLGSVAHRIEERQKEARWRAYGDAQDTVGYRSLSATATQTVNAAQELLETPEARRIVEHWSSVLSPEVASWWQPEAERDTTQHTHATALGRVLVLEDLSGDEEAEVLAGVREAFAEMGLTVYGVDSDNDDPLEVELLSEARNAVGLAALDDSDAQLRLKDFLDGREDLDAILWIGPSSEREETVYQLFVRRDLTAGETRSLPGGSALAAH